MAKKTVFKIFEIIGHGIDIDVASGTTNYLNNIEFKYFKPSVLIWDANNIGISYKNNITIIEFNFKGGSLASRPQILSTPPKPDSLKVDLTTMKVEMRSFLEIHFNWISFENGDKLGPLVPDTSGKSILIAQ